MAKLYKPIQFQHTADDFWTIYKARVCAVERRRAQFFALRAEGRSEDEVMGITKYAATTARLMIGRYHKLGLAAYVVMPITSSSLRPSARRAKN